mmetsp:Transcript_145879/g.466139  ORF Transcript_145879/g.466139 Transcript_145879/m.466139 type:complete len:435 (+) Transcript_145879:81-1385(+)
MGCAHGSSSSVLIPTSPSGSSGGRNSQIQLSFHQQYSLQGKLGSGARGIVHAVQNTRDNERLAVKVMSLRRASPEGGGGGGDGAGSGRLEDVLVRSALAEIQIMKQVNKHPNVVRFVQSFMQDGLAYIVMEKCDLSLWQALDRLPQVNERGLRRIFCEMLSGLESIHFANVVHRDVKPDNFLCAGPDATVRLCDFSCATRVTSEITRELKGIDGTAPFMAPEMVNHELYNAKVDVWGLGVVFYGILFGDFPYRLRRVNVSFDSSEAPSKTAQWKAVIAAGTQEPTFQTPAGEQISTDLLALARKLLDRQPTSRPTAREASRHRFFQQIEPEGGAEEPNLRSVLAVARKNGFFGSRKEGRTSTKESDLDRELMAVKEKYIITDEEKAKEQNAQSWRSDATTEAPYSTNSQHAGPAGKPRLSTADEVWRTSSSSSV